jgi:hypothetical protein
VILEAYAVSESPQPLVPAPSTREWMESFAGRHPHRCLPLAIANSYGWQLLLPKDVSAEWNGGSGLDAVTVRCQNRYQAVSNFGSGVLTFDVGYIFRTPPDHHLLVTGPSNFFKTGVAPMTAVVETDWLPYTFTFNYRFTEPCTVNWLAGEPYAQICVVPAGIQETVQPIIRNLGDNAQLAADHEAWRTRRSSFRERQASGNPEAIKQVWDKDYFLGRYADGRPVESKHTMKLRLKDPIDERRERSVSTRSINSPDVPLL